MDQHREPSWRYAVALLLSGAALGAVTVGAALGYRRAEDLTEMRLLAAQVAADRLAVEAAEARTAAQLEALTAAMAGIDARLDDRDDERAAISAEVAELRRALGR